MTFCFDIPVQGKNNSSHSTNEYSSTFEKKTFFLLCFFQDNLLDKLDEVEAEKADNSEEEVNELLFSAYLIFFFGWLKIM